MITQSRAKIKRSNAHILYEPNHVVKNNTTDYLTFPRASNRPGEGGYIIGASLVTDYPDNLDLAQFRLFLFSRRPAAFTDNEGFALAKLNADGDAQHINMIGYIDFGLNTLAQEAVEITTLNKIPYDVHIHLNMPFTADRECSIYGQLVALGDQYPGTAGAQFWVKLLIDQI